MKADGRDRTEFLIGWPKIELHTHLEGTISPELLRSFAIQYGLDRGTEGCLSEHPVRNRSDFWAYWDKTRFCRYAPDDIARIARHEFACAARRNVIYAEYRFNIDGPMAAGHNPEVILERLNKEIMDAKLLEGISINLILGLKRRPEIREVRRYADFCCEAWEQGWAAGIDLNGDEACFGTARYAPVLCTISDRGCPLTVHAGEWAGPESVEAALNCNVRRIGHGIRSIDDLQVLNRIISHKVHLEICVTSNLATGAFHSLDEHPVRRFLDLGVSLSVNSDDHALFGSDMVQELGLLIRPPLQVTEKELMRINSDSLDAAFTMPEEKDRIRLACHHKYLALKETACASSEKTT